MSKLIVEMEMPKSCPCDLIGIGYAMCCSAANTRERIDEYNECVKNGTRPSWCPIKGVLPQEHGRLIDASTVIGIQKDEEDNDFPVTVDDYLGLQFPVPTIVPATGRSKHGTTAD